MNDPGRIGAMRRAGTNPFRAAYTDEEIYRRRASQLLGQRLGLWWFDHLESAEGNWTAYDATSGTRTPVTTEPKGVLLVSSGALAGGRGAMLRARSSSAPQVTGGGGTSGDFYVALRTQTLQAPPVANSDVGIVFFSAAMAVLGQFVVRSGGSNTKFSAFANGVTMATTVDIDTNWHVHELVRVAGVTYYFIDGVLVGQSTTCFIAAAWLLSLYSGTSAASARSQNVDWVACGVP